MNRTMWLTLALALSGCADTAVEDVLVVINISPSGGAANVSTSVAPRVTFNAALDESTVTASNFLLQDVDGQDVELSLAWDDLTYTVEMTPTVELAEDAEYTVVITDVVDSDAGLLGVDIFSSFTTAGALSANVLPEADAGENQTVNPGETVTLDGSGSTDADGDALTYAWTYEYGPLEKLTLSQTDATASFLAEAQGKYVFSLTVNDGSEDSSKDYVTVIVAGGPPPEDDVPSDTEVPSDTDTDAPPPSDTDAPPPSDTAAPPPSDTDGD